MAKKSINILIFSGIWSFIIGILTALYLNLINYVIDFIWGYFNHHSNFSLRPAYPFLICLTPDCPGRMVGIPVICQRREIKNAPPLLTSDDTYYLNVCCTLKRKMR